MISQWNESLVSRGKRESQRSLSHRLPINATNDDDKKKRPRQIISQKETVALVICFICMAGFILITISSNPPGSSPSGHHASSAVSEYPLDSKRSMKLVPKTHHLWSNLMKDMRETAVNVDELITGKRAASIVLQLLFGHLFPLAPLQEGGPTLPLDLVDPKARELLRLLETASNSRWNLTHCSDGETERLILKARDMLAVVVERQCRGSKPLPLVLLRRVFLAVLISISNLGNLGPDAQACFRIARETSIPVLKSFSRALSCSRDKRRAMEFYHASKSGGTSFCFLAGNRNMSNPSFEMDSNCLVPGLGLEPRWTRLESGLDKNIVWAAVECPAWQDEPEMTCDQIETKLKDAGYDFFSNELAMHLASGSSNASRPCAQFESLLIMRNPVERVRSHVMEVAKSYRVFGLKDRKSSVFHAEVATRKNRREKLRSSAQAPNPYHRPRDLSKWKSWAPAVIDNYQTRWLLGRHSLHCRDFGSLNEVDLFTASLALLSTDNILIMEESYLNDVVLQLGIGWPGASLSNLHYRYAAARDLVLDLGFTNESITFLQDHQRLDSLLYHFGRYLLRLDVSFHAGVAALSGKLVAKPSNESLHSSGSESHRIHDFNSAIQMAGYRKVGLFSSGSAMSLRRGHLASSSLGDGMLVRKRAGKGDFQTPGVKAAFKQGYVNIENEADSMAQAADLVINGTMIPFDLMNGNVSMKRFAWIHDGTNLYTPLWRRNSSHHTKPGP